MSFGAHGKLTVDQAVIMLADTLWGEDLGQERADWRQALTIAELCDDYCASAWPAEVRQHYRH